MRQANLVRAIGVVVSCIFCYSCGGDSTPVNPATDVVEADSVNSLLSNDVEQASYRELTVSASTDIKSVAQCFCDFLYRSTLQFYHFRDQNAVLIIELDNQSLEFTASGVIHLFEATATEAEVSKWINNQHSDGLFIDPAKPQNSKSLAADSITVTSTAYVESLSGYEGDLYEKYQVEFAVANQFESERFFLNGFSDNTAVYLQVE